MSDPSRRRSGSSSSSSGSSKRAGSGGGDRRTGSDGPGGRSSGGSRGRRPDGGGGTQRSNTDKARGSGDGRGGRPDSRDGRSDGRGSPRSGTSGHSGGDARRSGGGRGRDGGGDSREDRYRKNRDKERDEAGSATAGPRSWGGVARRGAARIEPFEEGRGRGRAAQAWDRGRDSGDDAGSGSGADGQDEWILEEVRREATGAVHRGTRAAAPDRTSGGTGRASGGGRNKSGRSGETNAKASRRSKPAASTDHPAPRGSKPDDAKQPTPRAEFERAVGPVRAERLEKRLKDASRAFKRERYAEARQILRALVQEAPSSASARELLGITWYREGRWRDAIKELEEFRKLTGSTEQHPVLADCYRAEHRWAKVTELWDELREASPGADLVAEGRIVTAGALADQGRFDDAIKVLSEGRRKGKKTAERDLRMAYALADIEERAGDVPAARERFIWVRGKDPDFADVVDRVRALS